MPFVGTLAEDACHAEYFRDGEEHLVLVRVGYDESGDKNYSIMVGLSPQPPGELELIFALIEADTESDSERAIFDAREAANIINKDDRQKIMRAILSAAKLLLDQVRPKYFIMATRDGHLPQKALAKYYQLNQLFMKSGYSVTATDPYHGKLSWWMELDP